MDTALPVWATYSNAWLLSLGNSFFLSIEVAPVLIALLSIYPVASHPPVIHHSEEHGSRFFLVGYHTESLSKAEINVIHCSPLFQKSSHLILEGNEPGHDLPLLNPCWLFPIPFFPSMCPENLHENLFHDFSWDQSEVTVLEFPRSSFWPSWKMDATFAFLQVSGTSPPRGSPWPFRDDNMLSRT